MKHSMPLRPLPQRRPAVRRAALSAALCAALCAAPAAQATVTPYVGELLLFGGNFCPQGWLPADGRLLPIADNEVLFTLLGTTYGGNGVTTFGLPDLRGRAAVGMRPQTPAIQLGESGGTENVTLLPYNLPFHTHDLLASTQPATHATPAPGRVPAMAQNGGAYAAGGTPVNLQQATSTTGGGQQAFSVRGPFLAMQWCIATGGIYPSRP